MTFKKLHYVYVEEISGNILKNNNNNNKCSFNFVEHIVLIDKVFLVPFRDSLVWYYV